MLVRFLATKSMTDYCLCPGSVKTLLKSVSYGTMLFVCGIERYKKKAKPERGMNFASIQMLTVTLPLFLLTTHSMSETKSLFSMASKLATSRGLPEWRQKNQANRKGRGVDGWGGKVMMYTYRCLFGDGYIAVPCATSLACISSLVCHITHTPTRVLRIIIFLCCSSHRFACCSLVRSGADLSSLICTQPSMLVFIDVLLLTTHTGASMIRWFGWFCILISWAQMTIHNSYSASWLEAEDKQCVYKHSFLYAIILLKQ